jgi:hypothetical protein
MSILRVRTSPYIIDAMMLTTRNNNAVKPDVGSKGHKFERARGRRGSCGFKI